MCSRTLIARQDQSLFDKQMDKLRERLGLPHFKNHALRHTAKTGMTKIGVTRFIADKVLNHSDSSVGQKYDHYEYAKEKREALLKWERQIERIVTGRPDKDKVVSIR